MIEHKVRVTKDSSVTLVELPATSEGRLDGGRVSDVYSRLWLPPRAIPLLYGVLNQAGYRDVVSIAPQYNPGLKLTRGDRARSFNTDLLMFSAITRTIPQTEELAWEHKKRKPNSYVVVGGAHATALPEECLRWADIVVRGEGEETLRELMINLKNNGSPKGTKGISYKEGDVIIHEPDRALLSEQALADLPKPVYSEFVKRGIRTNAVWTSRGCPGACNFCFVPILYGDCYRRKSNEANIAHFKDSPSGVTFIIDDNFMGKPGQTKELLVRMKEEGLSVNSYIAQLRAQAGLISGAPRLLWGAGVHLVAVGFESQNDKTLKEIGKTTTAAQNREGARAIKEEGVRIHGMFMVGLDEDTPESVRETLEFAKKECDTAQFFAPGPVFGTEFASAMADQDRILTRDYYLYDGQNVVVRPKNFSPDGLQQTIFDMYDEFYAFKLFGDKVKKTIFGGPDSTNKAPLSETLRNLKYDLMTRMYAKHAVRSFVNDPQTRRHRENLKAWN